MPLSILGVATLQFFRFFFLHLLLWFIPFKIDLHLSSFLLSFFFTAFLIQFFPTLQQEGQQQNVVASYLYRINIQSSVEAIACRLSR
ncbi:hypothetical protein F5Y03DRAFT_361116 [Xylaria venustula]|nr:hypothetical protein F5Y03DRAFT_361116 [Xylaria venustula]